MKNIKSKKILERNAIKIFGTTKDIRKAGFILSKGELVNFGRDNPMLSRQHREISETFTFSPSKKKFSKLSEQYEGMRSFLKETNAIRLGEITYPDLNLELGSGNITKQQIKILNKLYEQKKIKARIMGKPKPEIIATSQDEFYGTFKTIPELEQKLREIKLRKIN